MSIKWATGRPRQIAVLILSLLTLGLVLAACEEQPAENASPAPVDDRVAALELTVLNLQSQIDNLPTPAPPVVITPTPEPTPAPTPFVIPTPTARATPPTGVPAALATGIVSTAGGTLNVRSAPSLDGEVIETLDDGAVLELTGEESVGETFTWLELTTGGWVAADFVDRQ